MESEIKWYVVHTYSGYENKVKANIEKIVENRGMHDRIVEVSVPVQDSVEIKNNQKKVVQRKVFPGYVLVKMLMDDDTWYVVRNTRGVTSFVGPGSKPVPLTEEEVLSMGIETAREVIDIAEGDSVSVSEGAFKGSVGMVRNVSLASKSVSIVLSIMGKEVPVELPYAQVKKIM